VVSGDGYCVGVAVGCGSVSVSCYEGADLDEVVSEDAVSAPGSGPGEGGQFCAVPAVVSFEMVDSAFASGSPFDLVPERFSVFELTAGSTGFGRAGNRYRADSQVVQIGFHRGVAVAPISRTALGTCPRRPVIRAIDGTSCGASAGLPISTVWSRMTPSALSTTWALYPNSTGLPRRPYGSGGHRHRGN
jgi:hypothetical protein